MEESRQTAEQLREQLRELKTKLEEARTRQGTLVARHRAAEARKRLAKSLSGLGNDAFSSFERFEQKVETSEAEAEAHVEVAGEMQHIEKEIRQIDQDNQQKGVEDELAALKSRLGKGESQ
jgi:phage shock protein A